MPTKINVSHVEWETLHCVDDSKTAVGRANKHVVNDVGVSSGFDHSSTKVQAENQTTVDNRNASRATNTAKTRGKREKDPNKPKHPISAYLFFAMELRPKLRALGDDTSGVAMGEKWRSVLQEERQRFEIMAIEDSERYYREMVAYNDGRLNSVTPPPPSADADVATNGLI
ncbi:hypothetical protein ACHAW5_008908 [Stephanodiscus triporus]|uniref:HMG box domain-containing protein n=1 Tax=Stephanodiscus triporus TaxID=2934178 RepID=A0ABD3Q926_9STRA